MSRRAVLLTLAGQFAVLALLLTVALDQYAHAQTDAIDGVNHRGYRGQVAARHASGESRIMMAGGTRAFEAGTPLHATLPARLRHVLVTGPDAMDGLVTVVNVAAPNAPRGAYAAQLDRHRDLAPDVVCIYVDLEPAAPASAGALAQVAGYVPALSWLAAIDARLGAMMPAAAAPSDDIRSVADAVTMALRMSRGTIVAVPEPATPAHRAEFEALMTALASFAADPRVAIVPLPNAPPVMRGGLLEPAAALQLETPVRSLLAAGPVVQSR